MFDPNPVESEDSFSAPIYLEAGGSDPAGIVEEELNRESEVDILKNAVSSLDERSQDIIQQRWLTDQKATLHQLADKYDISAERIRQLEQNALKKLRLSISD